MGGAPCGGKWAVRGGGCIVHLLMMRSRAAALLGAVLHGANTSKQPTALLAAVLCRMQQRILQRASTRSHS